MNRCLCPKPECSPVANDLIMSNPFIELGKNTLHLKKADLECERCGIPLCGDCGEYDIRYRFTEDMSAFSYYQVWLCPVCEEYIKQ